MLLCCVLCEWMFWKATTVFISIRNLHGSFEATYEVQKPLQKKKLYL